MCGRPFCATHESGTFQPRDGSTSGNVLSVGCRRDSANVVSPPPMWTRATHHHRDQAGTTDHAEGLPDVSVAGILPSRPACRDGVPHVGTDR